jgi:hypothetical protein
MKKVILNIDGIPHSTFKSLYDEGKFHWFQEPTKMISTFPSLTHPALSAIWGKEQFNSYESRDFDREKNKIVVDLEFVINRNNGGDSVMDKYDLKTTEAGVVFEAIKYYFGLQSHLGHPKELKNIKKFIASSNQELFRFWIAGYDQLLHAQGFEKAKEALSGLHEFIEEIKEQQDLEVIVFSDHGQTETKKKFLDIKKYSSYFGFRKKSKLSSNVRDYVLPQFGPVSFARIHCQDNIKYNIAQHLKDMEGVDHAFVWDGGKVLVYSNKGEAFFDKIGESFIYHPITGNPLQIDDSLHHKLIESKDWFYATAESKYPDSLHRIFNCFAKNRNPPNIAININDHYLGGLWIASCLYPIKTMHGNLSKESAEAVVMVENDHKEIPKLIRCEELRDYVKI